MVLWSTERTLYVQAVDRAGNPSISDEPCICTVWDLRAKPSSAVPAHRRNDVNGDGLADISTMFDLGNGRTAAWTAVARAAGGVYPPYLGWDSGINGGFPGYRTKHITGDFTGDGLADIAVFREDPDNRLRLFLLRSDSHRYDMGPAPLWEGPANSAWAVSRIQPSAADADGDGKLDLVATVTLGPMDYNLEVLRNTSAGAQVSFATPQVWWHNAPGLADPARMRIVTGDFNGDGKGDVGQFYNFDNGQTKLWIQHSTGTAFTAGVYMWDGGPNNVHWDRLSAVSGDVTGDGKADVVGMHDYGSHTKMLLWQGTDAGFSTASTWWDGISVGSSFLAPRARLVTGDYNDDGKTDIATVYDSAADSAKVHLFVTNGTGTAAIAPNLATPAWSGAIGAVPANLTPSAGKQYRLVASHSGKCVDVVGMSVGDGAGIQQYTCLEAAQNQRVTFEPVGAGPYYQIRFAHSGKCLDVKEFGRADGSALQQYACGREGNQQFRLEFLGGAGREAQIRVRAAHSDKCLDVQGSQQQDTAVVYQWGCLGGLGTNQAFHVRQVA